MKVLVTGGAGYIGSHAVVELLDQGYEVVVVDSLVNGYRDMVDKRATFYKKDVRDAEALREIFEKESIECVMHFAAYIKVPESMTDPLKYYHNNLLGVITLLQVMAEFNISKFIFSSTAAVYGDIKGDSLVTEDFITNPISPYGMSKLMAENIINDYAIVSNLSYAIFRYFNVVGAHEKYNIGQRGDGVTALVPLMLDAALGKRDELLIYGDDYATKDGTGVRDYIHVVDLVKAHILGLKSLGNIENGIYNLGNGNGFSVKDMVKAAEKVIGREINKRIVDRRFGDPAIVVASSAKAKKILGWVPEYTDMQKIIQTVWEFKNRN